MKGIFISAPCDGQIYVAERSRKGKRLLLWSVMPHAPTAPDRRIEARYVPLPVKRQAWRAFYAANLEPRK